MLVMFLIPDFTFCLYFPQCCKTTMMNKVISSENDLIGVVLFGTDKKDNKMDLPHIAMLQDLLQPSADKIKQFETMLKGIVLRKLIHHIAKWIRSRVCSVVEGIMMIVMLIIIIIKLKSIYLYFPPSSQLVYLCFCPVGLLLL